jgi:N6-adenosine-specific RNA methylase IME4
MPYPTMTLAEIKALPVSELAEPDAHLYLWTTNGFLRTAFELLETWEFRYSTTLVWAKAPIGAGLGGAWGISTEFILYGRRGTLPPSGRVGRTWFDWKRPYDGRGKPMHSAKPDAFLDLVEQVSPGPYLEMFARRNRLGWDTWGDECHEHVTLP